MGFINPLLIHTHGDQSSAGSICFVHLKQISVTKRVTIATHDSRDVTQSLQCLFIFDRRANIITTRMNLSPLLCFLCLAPIFPRGLLVTSDQAIRCRREEAAAPSLRQAAPRGPAVELPPPGPDTAQSRADSGAVQTCIERAPDIIQCLLL